MGFKEVLTTVQGSVAVPAFTKPILLIGRENMNRAVHGDVVVVEVFDEKEWKAPADEVIDQDCMYIIPPRTSAKFGSPCSSYTQERRRRRHGR